MISAIALDAAVSLAGLVAAPAFDFLKKKFIPASADTPERTMGTLATTSPDALPGYVEGLASHLRAKGEYFNRDVVGDPSLWVVDLRAAIRPITVCGSLALLIAVVMLKIEIDPSIKYFCEINVTSWMGSRFVKD